MRKIKGYGLLIACAFIALILFIASSFQEGKNASMVDGSVIDEEIMVKVDGAEIKDLTGYEKEDGTIMIPLQALAKELGYELIENEQAKMIELMKGPHWIVIHLDEDAYSFGKMAPMKLGHIPEVVADKVYVPLAFVSEILHLNVQVKQQQLVNIVTGEQEQEEETEEYMSMIGEIVSIESSEENVIIELKNENETEGYEVIFLAVDENSEIIDPITNELFSANDLKEGMRVRGFYGPMIAAIYPPKSYAPRIELINDKAIKTGFITEIIEDDSNQYVLVGTMEDGVRLLITEDTAIVSAENEAMSFVDLKEDMKVEAFYGPIQTMSLPPISTAVKVAIK